MDGNDDLPVQPPTTPTHVDVAPPSQSHSLGSDLLLIMTASANATLVLNDVRLRLLEASTKEETKLQSPRFLEEVEELYWKIMSGVQSLNELSNEAKIMDTMLGLQQPDMNESKEVEESKSDLSSMWESDDESSVALEEEINGPAENLELTDEEINIGRAVEESLALLPEYDSMASVELDELAVPVNDAGELPLGVEHPVDAAAEVSRDQPSVEATDGILPQAQDDTSNAQIPLIDLDEALRIFEAANRSDEEWFRSMILKFGNRPTINMLLFTLMSAEHRCWMRQTWLLQATQHAVRLLTTRVLRAYQQKIIRRHNITPRKCPSCKSKGKPTKKCEFDICNVIAQDIEDDLLRGEKSEKPPSWKTTNYHEWTTNEWTLGQLFVPHSTGATSASSDMAAHTNVMYHCKLFRSIPLGLFRTVDLPRMKCRELNNTRNDTMHVMPNAITPLVLNENRKKFDEFIRSQIRPVLPTASERNIVDDVLCFIQEMGSLTNVSPAVQNVADESSVDSGVKRSSSSTSVVSAAKRFCQRIPVLGQLASAIGFGIPPSVAGSNADVQVVSKPQGQADQDDPNKEDAEGPNADVPRQDDTNEENAEGPNANVRRQDDTNEENADA